ncbi:carboxymethylenebutenolidase [Limnohabitans sp. TS-CS-82]|jgi:carboxymethylenebutenolidase|uniref:dienelactone hydrolase family protein n=1 Tax=Limnohabitans sp. TS-CS-82 TaxID=2094193 RepID=UPI000CF2135A|nr:dienelactone hydrolase family protein [Limnohabitans sp. TS-CS-82]PQA80190.1 carboxymethylenebutenolidase [Limnohabitans sp. TS-CS-82]
MHTNWIQDTQALLNSKDESAPTRRLALQTALGLGYAASAAPLMAQTAVKTSSEGLIEGEVVIDVNGFKMPAYRSAPKGKTNLPVVLVISEIFGVHEYIADVTRRFAKAGYLAIAPELFVRQGDPSSYGEMGKLIAEVISKVPDAQVMGDLDATLQWASKNGGNANRAAITGFCWGGRITWLYAAHNPKLKAGVAWYGRVEGQTNANNPKHAVDLAVQLKAPVLGLYGGDDAGIPVTSVNNMKEVLALSASRGNKAAKASEFVLYPDAPHAFHADYRPSYRAAPATDGWNRALAWFKQYV